MKRLKSRKGQGNNARPATAKGDSSDDSRRALEQARGIMYDPLCSWTRAGASRVWPDELWASRARGASADGLLWSRVYSTGRSLAGRTGTCTIGSCPPLHPSSESRDAWRARDWLQGARACVRQGWSALPPTCGLLATLHWQVQLRHPPLSDGALSMARKTSLHSRVVSRTGLVAVSSWTKAGRLCPDDLDPPQPRPWHAASLCAKPVLKTFPLRHSNKSPPSRWFSSAFRTAVAFAGKCKASMAGKMRHVKRRDLGKPLTLPPSHKSNPPKAESRTECPFSTQSPITLPSHGWNSETCGLDPPDD